MLGRAPRSGSRIEQYGGRSGRAVVQAVNGTLYEVAADGNLRPLAVGQDLPDGVEVRTAKDSDAMLQLRDGSVSRAARALRLFDVRDGNRPDGPARAAAALSSRRPSGGRGISMSPPPTARWPSPARCSAWSPA